MLIEERSIEVRRVGTEQTWSYVVAANGELLEPVSAPGELDKLLELVAVGRLGRNRPAPGELVVAVGRL